MVTIFGKMVTKSDNEYLCKKNLKSEYLCKSAPTRDVGGAPKKKEGDCSPSVQKLNLAGVDIQPILAHIGGLGVVVGGVVAVGPGDVLFHESPDMLAGRGAIGARAGEPTIGGEFNNHGAIAE